MFETLLLQGASAPATTYHPAWDALPTALWVVLALVLVFALRSELRELLGQV